MEVSRAGRVAIVTGSGRGLGLAYAQAHARAGAALVVNDVDDATTSAAVSSVVEQGGTAVGLTAVGDTINAASRLEGLAKELGAELVISAILADRAGLDLLGHEKQTVAVRGRTAPIDAWIIPLAESLRSTS